MYRTAQKFFAQATIMTLDQPNRFGEMLMPDAAIYPSVSTDPNDLPILAADNSSQRGILLVEPDSTILTTHALLLTNSDYCVATAFSDRETFVLRHTKVVTVAILSASLGYRILCAVAEAVRRQWPLARILILGRPASMLEDHLYDDQIDHYPAPKQLLDALERLSKDSWNQCSNSFDWSTGRSGAGAARSPIHESDPTKSALSGATENKNCRDRPSRCCY